MNEKMDIQEIIRLVLNKMTQMVAITSGTVIVLHADLAKVGAVLVFLLLYGLVQIGMKE